MDKFIFRIEVKEISLPDKLNWLGEKINFDSYDEEQFIEKTYELYFPDFDSMGKKINEITEGFKQYWADVTYDIYENNCEWLEYHNGQEAWDKEIIIETSRVYLISSFLQSIDQVR